MKEIIIGHSSTRISATIKGIETKGVVCVGCEVVLVTIIVGIPEVLALVDL